ncbi:hypothetical protein AGIG_G9684 [Arapaima gigas]
MKTEILTQQLTSSKFAAIEDPPGGHSGQPHRCSTAPQSLLCRTQQQTEGQASRPSSFFSTSSMFFFCLWTKQYCISTAVVCPVALGPQASEDLQEGTGWQKWLVEDGFHLQPHTIDGYPAGRSPGDRLALHALQA